MDAIIVAKVTFVWLMLGFNDFRFHFQFHVAPFGDGKVIEEDPVGVAGNYGRDASVVMGCPIVEAVVYLITEAGICGSPGFVFRAQSLEACPENVDKEFADTGSPVHFGSAWWPWIMRIVLFRMMPS